MRRAGFIVFAVVFIAVAAQVSAEDKPANIDSKKLVGKWEVKEGPPQA